MTGATTISTVWLATVVLLSLRLAAVFAMTPLLAAASVPVTIRVLIVLGLAIGLSLGAPSGLAGVSVPPEVVSSPGLLVQAAFTELALGATLALGILLAFAAFTMAGQLPGIQMGLGLGQVLDPATNQAQSAVTSAFQQLGVLVFFLAGGHHALLRGLAYSLERFPLGRPWSAAGAAQPLLVQVMGLFSLAFALAVPVVFCLLLLEVALGVVARNMPQVNMIAMGIPVKIVGGLAALALWFGGMGDAMGRVYASIYRTWDAIFAGGA
jgi:flagellar biosynthetic protein FliR